MADNTKIAWTEATWNPTVGCSRTSPGCDHCYALTLAKRLKAMGNPRYQVDGDERTSGPGFGVTLHHDQLDLPLRWRKSKRVFVNSMSDLFHPAVPSAFIAEVFAVMSVARAHTFQILTKRPQRMRKLLTSAWFHDDVRDLRNTRCDESARWEHGHWPMRHVWLGCSIESDRYAFRANHLRETPAAVRFLSLEPLLGPLPSLDLTGIDWVIVGGESGPKARPMHPDWVREIRDGCVNAGVPFFFKQFGSWAPVYVEGRQSLYIAHDGTTTDDIYREGPERDHLLGPDVEWRTLARVYRVGKKAAGRELTGRTWDEYPAVVS